MDNAATSFPKAPNVPEAVADFLSHIGASAGRAAHRLSRKADELLWETRTLVADLLGAGDPQRVAFSMNVTQALNMAMMGILRPGDRVVTTSMEHNSVMRPLRYLEKTLHIHVSVAECAGDGTLDPQALLALVTDETRMIVMTHASNVTGTLLPVEQVARGKRKAVLLVDAAQTAGAVPIQMETMGVDLLAFTGHKALLGPPGIGGLCVAAGVEITPLIRGGTGTRSESHETPTELPLALEAGTHNMAGVAGLWAALRYLEGRTVEAIRAHELSLSSLLLEGLREIQGVRLYGPADPACRTPAVPLNLEGVHPDHLAGILDQAYGILGRSGLHCAPSAHRTIGTFPDGTVRLSPGPFQSPGDMERVIQAIREISRQFFG